MRLDLERTKAEGMRVCKIKITMGNIDMEKGVTKNASVNFKSKCNIMKSSVA